MGTSDRRPYETATVLDQDFLDEAHDNLTNKLELDVELETATGTIYASDINKYTGDKFYEALLNFPVIRRTIGEFLDSTLEFEDLELEITNADARFNDLIPSGANFDGWIARQVTVRLGLAQIESTYKTIFEGFLTEEGGFTRTTNSLKLRYRNRFDKLNVQFPQTVLSETSFPNIEDENKNQIVPIIYGDWTTAVEPGGASVPAFVVNGADVTVNDEGPSENSTLIQTIISENTNRSLDTTQVYLLRGDVFHLMDSADIVNVVNNRQFDIRQVNTTPAGVTLIENDDGSTDPYAFTTGDKFFVKVTGKDVGSPTLQDNAVEQARDLLEDFGGLGILDFTANWNTFAAKNSPAESAVFSIKSRVWVGEQVDLLQYVLSMMEQVRLEIFINRDNRVDISSLHLDDFVASPTFEVKNWDIEEDSFEPKLDDRNNFNRARAVFNFLPNRNEEFTNTRFFRNQAAITQHKDKEITKQVIYPNLYVLTDVENQLKETMKIASATPENINCTLTWRSMLLDIGDFVKLNVDIDGTVFEDVPALIREIGYDPDGIKIPVRLWSFQMLPFTGYTPGYSGTVGGITAIITAE